MTERELKNRYFEWMYQLVSGKGTVGRSSYRMLLRHLDSISFRYTLPMDGNRAEDGIDLRYRFGRDNSYDQTLIAAYLDDHPCSVLEMMVALALRCEEDIAYDPELGDRTYVWFSAMIDSMGLTDMDDYNYDERTVDRAISTMLDRSYARSGEGGLFTVHSRRDMRIVEIWYQMCWYLDEVLNVDGQRYEEKMR